MNCRVHGSPAYTVTRPTRAKRDPTAAALTCTAGFFTWAQPAIPARAAPAINEYNKNFFIPKRSELLAKRFRKSIIHAPPRERDARGDAQTARATPIRCRQTPALKTEHRTKRKLSRRCSATD